MRQMFKAIRIGLGTWLLRGDPPAGRRGIFIGDKGARIVWADGPEGIFIFGADVGLLIEPGKPSVTLFDNA